MLSALVEEAVTVGDLVRLFTFRQGNANLVELTLPEDSPYVGKPVGLIPWPTDVSLVAILRDGRVITPRRDDPIEAGDELLFVASAESEEELQEMLSPHQADRREDTRWDRRRDPGTMSHDASPASANSGQPMAILATPRVTTWSLR